LKEDKNKKPSSSEAPRSFRKLGILALVNLFFLFVLFGVIEFGFRVKKHGFVGAIKNLPASLKVPYNLLSTDNWFIYDPVFGFRQNPNHKEINELSLRHGDIKIPKPEGTTRVVILGDSLPFDKGGFAYQIGDHLAEKGNIELINASVIGYTSWQEVQFYKKYVGKVDPDLVLWIYCLNDNYRILHQFRGSDAMLWTKEAEKSLKINSKWDYIVSRSYVLTYLFTRSSRMDRKRARGHWKFPWQATVDFNIAWKDYSWNQHDKNMKELINFMKDSGAKLAVVIVPYEPQLYFDEKDKDFDYVVMPQRKLINLCKKYNIPCLDLWPPLRELYKKGKKYYTDRIHFTPGGHIIATEEILKFISEENLLTPDQT